MRLRIVVEGEERLRGGGVTEARLECATRGNTLDLCSKRQIDERNSQTNGRIRKNTS